MFRVSSGPKPKIVAAVVIVLVFSIEEFAIAFIVGVPTLKAVLTILCSRLGFEVFTQMLPFWLRSSSFQTSY